MRNIKYVGIKFKTGDDCGIASVTIENTTKGSYVVINEEINLYVGGIDVSLGEFGDLTTWFVLDYPDDSYSIIVTHSGKRDAKAEGPNYLVAHDGFLTNEELEDSTIDSKAIVWHTDHEEEKEIVLVDDTNVGLTDYVEFTGDAVEDTFSLAGLQRAEEFLEFYLDDVSYFPDHYFINWGSDSEYSDEIIDSDGYFSVKFNAGSIPASGVVVKIVYTIKYDKLKLNRTMSVPSDGLNFKRDTAEVRLVRDSVELSP